MKYLIFLVMVLFIGCGSDSSVDTRTLSASDVNDSFPIQYSRSLVKWDSLKELIDRPIDNERYVNDSQIINIKIQFYTLPYSDATYDKISISVSSSAPPPYSQTTISEHYYYNNQEVSQEFVEERREQVAKIKAEEDRIRAKNLKELFRIFTERNDLSQYLETKNYIQNFNQWDKQFLLVNIKLRKDKVRDFIELNQGVIVWAFKNAHINDNFIEGKIYPNFVYDKNSTKQKIYNIPNIGLIRDLVYNESLGVSLPNFQDGTFIISTKESLDVLVEETNKYIKNPITNGLDGADIDFNHNSIVIVYHTFGCVRKPQTFISIDDENNASIQIKIKPSKYTTCSAAMTPITQTFVVSKDILTINGEDNF